MAKKEYSIGSFNEVVCFYRPERSETASGERETQYVPCCERFAEVTDRLSSQEEAQEALPEVQTLLVKAWDVSEASTEWRIQFRNEQYDIIRIDRKRMGVTFYYVRRTDQCNE